MFHGNSQTTMNSSMYFDDEYEDYDIHKPNSSESSFYEESLSSEQFSDIVMDQEKAEGSLLHSRPTLNIWRRRKPRSKGQKLPIENALPRVQMEFASQRVANSYAEHNIAREAHAKLTGKELRLYPDDFMSLNLSHRTRV